MSIMLQRFWDIEQTITLLMKVPILKLLTKRCFHPTKINLEVLQINEITFCKALSILYTNNCSTAPYSITTITLEVKMNVNKQPFPTVQLLRKPPFLDCSFHISPTCTFYNLCYHCCHAKSAVYTLKCCMYVREGVGCWWISPAAGKRQHSQVLKRKYT